MPVSYFDLDLKNVIDPATATSQANPLSQSDCQGRQSLWPKSWISAEPLWIGCSVWQRQHSALQKSISARSYCRRTIRQTIWSQLKNSLLLTWEKRLSSFYSDHCLRCPLSDQIPIASNHSEKIQIFQHFVEDIRPWLANDRWRGSDAYRWTEK